jgi:hypothetical protein
MNIDLKTLLSKLKPAIAFLRRYTALIAIAIFVGMYGFLILRINQFTAAEPGDDAVTEKLQGVQRPKVDQSIVDKMHQLEDQNIQVQTLFKQARDNPFTE